jgi:glycosyltransferase involved in cell wall biosynthesis
MTAPITVLELRSVWGTGGGPEKTILLGASLHDKTDFQVIVCYIRDLRDGVFAIGERARQLAVDYVEIAERHSLDPAVWGKLKTLVRERGVQIVHAHDHKTDLLAYLLSKRLAVTPLATSHGWSGYSLRERLVYYPADIKLLARFPRVIAVSSKIRERLVAKGLPASRVTLLLNSIAPSAFRRNRTLEGVVRMSLGVPGTARIVGAVGRLERVKRFDVLLAAFARLTTDGSNLHLVIVGEGTLGESLKTQARELGIGARCHWLGHVNDIAMVHHAFDVFVQSSESEGTPNAVLEAMAMETPIVATDVGGTRELVAPNVHGLIVPRHDVSALASAIQQVLDDPDSAATKVRAARERVESELSFDARTRSLERIYLELASGRHMPARSTPPAHA